MATLLDQIEYPIRLNTTRRADVARIRYLIFARPQMVRYFRKATIAIDRRCGGRSLFPRAFSRYSIKKWPARRCTASAIHLGVGEGVAIRRASLVKNIGRRTNQLGGAVDGGAFFYSEATGVARSDFDAERFRHRSLNALDTGIRRYRAPYGSVAERTYKFVPEFREKVN